ncbi:hypothetical protein ACH5RR_005180 [Cinchona calisaya]|uniref:Uncharacterized protein n=1 Tax=Cinchona calisaya TaxID=153742 RepID=A0ABD3AKF9_9GENT
MLYQFYWECENLPDYRHTPEVERILNQDPIFEKKENPTPEDIEENEKWWEGFGPARLSSSQLEPRRLLPKSMNLSLKGTPLLTERKTKNCGRFDAEIISLNIFWIQIFVLFLLVLVFVIGESAC